MFNKVLAALAVNSMASADCATGAMLDSFMIAECTCPSGYFQVTSADVLKNVNNNSPNYKDTRIGKLTGSCVGTAPTTANPNSLLLGVQDSAGTYYYFKYGFTGYIKYTADSITALSTALTAMPSEVTKATATSSCKWYDMFTYTATGSNYIAGGYSDDGKTACMYYGPSPECAAPKSYTTASKSKSCTTTSSAATAFSVAALSLIAALTAAMAL
jgi:hypothetical protein